MAAGWTCVVIRTREATHGCIGQVVADNGHVLAETQAYPPGRESTAHAAATMLANMLQLEIMLLPPSLSIVRFRGRLGLRNPEGGIWWPTIETTDELTLAHAYAHDRGEWSSLT